MSRWWLSQGGRGGQITSGCGANSQNLRSQQAPNQNGDNVNANPNAGYQDENDGYYDENGNWIVGNTGTSKIFRWNVIQEKNFMSRVVTCMFKRWFLTSMMMIPKKCMLTMVYASLSISQRLC